MSHSDEGVFAYAGTVNLTSSRQQNLSLDRVNRLLVTDQSDYGATSIPTTCFQTVNLRLMISRYTLAVQKCLPTRKCEVITPKAARKRCAWPADLNPLITGSRNRVD
jgi:hypothetical protein